MIYFLKEFRFNNSEQFYYSCILVPDLKKTII